MPALGAAARKNRALYPTKMADGNALHPTACLSPQKRNEYLKRAFSFFLLILYLKNFFTTKKPLNTLISSILQQSCPEFSKVACFTLFHTIGSSERVKGSGTLKVQLQRAGDPAAEWDNGKATRRRGMVLGDFICEFRSWLFQTVFPTAEKHGGNDRSRRRRRCGSIRKGGTAVPPLIVNLWFRFSLSSEKSGREQSEHLFPSVRQHSHLQKYLPPKDNP